MTWPVVAALALTALVMFSHPGVREGYDWVRMHVFYKTHYRETLLEGRLPLWNPYTALGRPFLADIETATLYPPNLFYLAGVPAGLATNLFLHFLLLLLGMRALARRLGCRETTAWFGALGFALGAPLLGRLQSGQLQVFCSLCWMPVVLAAALAVRDRPGARGAVRLAAAVALLFLAGSPPMFWVATWMTVGVLAVEWSAEWRAGGNAARFAWLAAAGMLAAGLAAVQALPFLELAAQGNRNGLPAEYALAHGISGASWLSLLTSRPLGAFSYWEHNLYAGLPLVLASLAALRRWRSGPVLALLAVAVLFSLLAAGASTPLLPWLVEHAPGWNALRFPPRYGLALAMALCLLGALGLEQIARSLEAAGARRRAARWLCASLIVLNAGECVRAYFERAERYAGPPIAQAEADLAGEFRAAGLLAAGKPPPRVVAPPWIVRENSGLLHGFGTLTGFGNPFLQNVWSEIHGRLRLEPDAKDPVNVPVPAFVVPPSFYAGLDISAHWDAGTKRIEPPFAAPTRASLDGPGVAVVDDFREATIVVRTSADQPRRLLLAESWYPGWQATVDGVPVPVEAAGWRRAVELPAGSHRVVLAYRPSRLRWGAGLTFVALLAAAGLWWTDKRALLQARP